MGGSEFKFCLTLKKLTFEKIVQNWKIVNNWKAKFFDTTQFSSNKLILFYY